MELLLHLFDLYVGRSYPPDILSREHGDDDKMIIRFEWFSGKSREFGYTEKAYNAIWEKFNSYWKARF